MKVVLYILRGKAIIEGDGLRCANPRSTDEARPCHKLIAKKNPSGQLAGSFKCERCAQEVVIKCECT